MLKLILIFLNSRSFAAGLMGAMSLVLALSTWLPNPRTMGEHEWRVLTGQKPFVSWLTSHFSTPYLVTSPVFCLLVMLLFLSTLVCTVTRLTSWLRSRSAEFSKEQAFSFSFEVGIEHNSPTIRQFFHGLLVRRGWDIITERGNEGLIAAQRGMNMGFWGSIIFHCGLLVCFAAIPITAGSRFDGTAVITEGVTLPLREAVSAGFLGNHTDLPQIDIRMEQLHSKYAAGRYKLEFGGLLHLSGSGSDMVAPLEVNHPAHYKGFQFSLQEFGFSPQLEVRRGEAALFNYFTNLRNPEEGDYFPLGDDGMRLFLIFFPDFIQEGSRIGTRSRDTNNPKLMFKIMRGSETVAKGLVGPGEVMRSGEYLIHFSDLKRWVGLSVTRQQGLGVVFTGFLLIIAGLFIRFLSNERRLELELSSSGSGTVFRLSGYSRYYPAFLEREVRELAEMMRCMDR